MTDAALCGLLAALVVLAFGAVVLVWHRREMDALADMERAIDEILARSTARREE